MPVGMGPVPEFFWFSFESFVWFLKCSKLLLEILLKLIRSSFCALQTSDKPEISNTVVIMGWFYT